MSADRQGELPIQYILAAIWRFRTVVAAVFSLCVFVGILHLQTATRYYTVGMSVTAVEDSGNNNKASSLVSQSLALLGASTDSNQGNLFSEYQAGLKSTETARVLLLSQQDLIHRIFSAEWSPEARDWVEPHGFLISVKKFVRTILGIPRPPWTKPNAQIVADYLDQSIDIEKDKDSPIVTVSIVTSEPQLGLDVLNAVHEAADNLLRQRALARASSYIDYLNKRQQQADVVDVRQGIGESIVDQERVRMRAESVLPFSADLFARPSVSTYPTSPSALANLLGAAVMGLVFGIFAALLCNKFNFNPWKFLREKLHKGSFRSSRKYFAQKELLRDPGK